MRSLPISLLCIIASFLFLSSCGGKDKYADSPLIGTWRIKTQIIEDGVDMTQSRWEVWDALQYDFKPGGVLIISGGPEPLENLECRYDIVGDSTLHIYRPSQGNTIEEHYSILSLSNDTIWLRNNASYIVYTDSVSNVASNGIEFLQRF